MTQACNLPKLASAHHEQPQSLVDHSSFLTSTTTSSSTSPTFLHHRIAPCSDSRLLSDKFSSNVGAGTTAASLSGAFRGQVDSSSVSLLDLLRSFSGASKESHDGVKKASSPSETSNIGPHPVKREKFAPTPSLPIPRRQHGQHQRPLMPKMSLLDVPPYQALGVSNASTWSAAWQPNSRVRPSSAFSHSSVHVQPYPPTPVADAATPWRQLSDAGDARVMTSPSVSSPFSLRDGPSNVASDVRSPTSSCSEEYLPLPAIPPQISVGTCMVNELPSSSPVNNVLESGLEGMQRQEKAVRQHFGSRAESGLFDSLEQLALTATAGTFADALEHGQCPASISSNRLSMSSEDHKNQNDPVEHSHSSMQSTTSPLGISAPLPGHLSSPPMHALRALSLSSPDMRSLPFLPPLESSATSLLRKSFPAKSAPLACVGQAPDDVVCYACREQFDDLDGFLIVRPGDVLCERYFVEKILGQGTFGTVLQVLDLRLQAKLAACDKDRRVNLVQCRMALKIIRSSPKYRIASRSEISILETIHQPLDAFLACLSATDERTEAIFKGPKYCIRMHYWFEYRHHLCMVFPLLHTDLYCFMEKSHFSPFPLHCVQQIGKQLLTAVAYLHSLGVIHTDLKPENIMLLSQDSIAKEGAGAVASIREGLVSTKSFSAQLSLIDFGSALRQDDYHADIVSTRHYRAPEITLELGWSFPCDIWSVGCILMELFLGHQLFKTHDVSTHLKLMEVLSGPFPHCMIHPTRYVLSNKSIAADSHPPLPYFSDAGKVIFPLKDTPPTSVALVQAIRPLSHLIPASVSEGHRLFLDLMSSLLMLDPKKRISSREALFHPFFSCSLSMEEEEGYPF